MLRQALLLIFGWFRTPERLVQRGAEMITASLRDREIEAVKAIPASCLLALSQTAYDRARRGNPANPRFIYFCWELEKICDSLERALRGHDPRDERVYGIISWHDLLSIVYTFDVHYRDGRVLKKEARTHKDEAGMCVWTLADGSEETELGDPIKYIVSGAAKRNQTEG